MSVINIQLDLSKASSAEDLAHIFFNSVFSEFLVQVKNNHSIEDSTAVFFRFIDHIVAVSIRKNGLAGADDLINRINSAVSDLYLEHGIELPSNYYIVDKSHIDADETEYFSDYTAKAS